MDFSVIVPAYDAERTIDRCLDALLAQEHPSARFEVLVVDNGSTDRTRDLARARPGVRVLVETAAGPYAARNRGIAEARAERLVFTDAGCAPRPEWLATLTRVFEARDPAVVLGQMRIAGRSKALRALGAWERAKDAYALESDDPSLYYGHAGNMAVHRRVFEELGPFDARLRGSDTILVRRVVDRYSTSSVAYCPEAVVDRIGFDGVGSYLRKLAAYGRSFRGYGKAASARPLSAAERWRVFRAMRRDEGLSPARAVALLAVLGLGFGAWWAGRVDPRAGPLRPSASEPPRPRPTDGPR